MVPFEKAWLFSYSRKNKVEGQAKRCLLDYEAENKHFIQAVMEKTTWQNTENCVQSQKHDAMETRKGYGIIFMGLQLQG